jgi:dipeptidyl aminopeptidase/acylaminoacyl peptidase
MSKIKNPDAMGLTSWALTLILALAVHGSASGQVPPGPGTSRRIVQPDDIVKLMTVADPRISPDGKEILFMVSRTRAAGEPDRSVIWIIPADGTAPPRPFILGDGMDASPRWSPDGRTVAFISSRDDPTVDGPLNRARSRRLWAIPAAGGEATPLTSVPGDVSRFAWSPDGRKIAFLVPDPETDQEKSDRLARKDWVEVDGSFKPARLWIFDLDSRTSRKSSPPDLHVCGLEWSPDGRRMALRVAPTPGINDFFYHSRIVLFDPESGTLGGEITTFASGDPKWSPDGSRIAYSVIGEDGITSTPFVRNLRSGLAAPLAPDDRALVGEMEWSADSTALIAQVFEGTHFELARVDARDASRATLVVSAAQGAQFSVSGDGRRIAFVANTPDHPDEVWVLEGKKARRLTDVNGQVMDWALGSVRELVWKNSNDGKKIYGVLVTPPGFKEGAPVKTVVQIHGGPEWAWWSGWLGSWHEWAQLLASHGYAVFLPNPRGSDGQGSAFARAVVGDWGGGDYRDIMDGVDALVKAGIADPDRLAIGGWSYGGFMSLWAITHTDRFKAAVVGAGVTDLVSLARITDTPDFPLGYYGDVPSHLALYDAHSPIRMLERVGVPVLVLHGEADTRVPISQGEALYVGLRMLGKPVRMVRYPREPHWFREQEHQRNVLEQVLAWFDSHL